jgi:hypothetical protein
MLSNPIHQNLSTSFVNVGALVKHLYRLQFVGRVHIEMSSYEADVAFRSPNRVHAREFDHISGTLSEGEKALRNILVRAKEPNGRIHVYPEHEPAIRQPEPKRVFVDEAIASGARKMAYGICDTMAAVAEDSSDRSLARDREELKELILELLKNAESAYAKQRLDFEGLFRNACQLNSDRYEFLDTEAGAIDYADGRLFVSERVSAQQLANGVSAVLCHMLLRLRENRELKKLCNFTIHRLRLVLGRRNPLLERLMIRRQFEKLVEY